MKKHVQIILCCLFLVVNTNAQISSSCSSSLMFRTAYQLDAADMALSRIYALKSNDTALIEIPSVYIDTVMNGLSAIYNTNNAIQADSVFNSYCIHAFPNGFINTNLEVDLDTSIAWTHAWMSGATTTGNAGIDNFMSRYGFYVTGHLSISGLNVAYLHTERAINTKCFMDSLARFAGIYTCRKGLNIGDASKHIYYTRDTSSHYAFRIGWGDCMAGCSFSKIWYYTVDNSCTVWLDSVVVNNFFGAGGFPTADNCSLGVDDISLGTNEVIVYPNPGSGFVTIESKLRECSFEVFDITGRMVMKGYFDIRNELNVKDWNSGLYLVSVILPNGISQKIKFLKE